MNQYFGDINDYLKYGLLRCFAAAELRVGVCWMLTKDDSRSDGRKIGYLSQPERWRSHDPVLFDTLARVAQMPNSRSIRHAENNEILPNTAFFRALVPDNAQERKAWFADALDILGGADLL
jgi:hypothetical protein